MSAALDQVWAKVTSQKTALPALYGDIDFSITPERFTDDPAQSVAKRLGWRASKTSRSIGLSGESQKGLHSEGQGILSTEGEPCLFI